MNGPGSFERSTWNSCPGFAVGAGNMPSFSILTPTGGRLPYLQACVESVRQQVRFGADIRLEHIIVCTGGDAETRAWLEAGAPPETVCLYDDAALSPSQARNRALEVASGDWILVLDDDDLYLQRTVFYFAQAIAQHPERRWFTADFVRVDEHLRYLPGQDVYGYQFGTDTQMLQAFFAAEAFAQGNVCIARRLLDEAGPYDEARAVAEDLELYARLLLAGAVPLALPMVSHLHRVHSHNTSKGIDTRRHHQDLAEIYSKLEEPLRARGIELRLPQA